MGTQAAPNLVMSLIDLSDGSLDSGKTVELVVYGGTYPGNAIALTEIATTGRYKKETAGGAAAVTQGVYLVYVGGTLEGVFVHGYEGIGAHLISSANPHGVVASQVNITDTGSYFTGTTTELALQEIGAALATKASTSNTILADNSTQSVDAAKPKVTNLNADKLDGYHAGNNANQIPVLDGNARLPSSAIPLSLPNTTVAKVGGLQPGTGNNNLATINSEVVPGLLHTSVLGKAVGAVADMIPQLGAGATKLRVSLLGIEVGEADGNLVRVHGTKQAGYVHDSLLNKEVGVTDTDIPQISTGAVPETGKLHSLLLGKHGIGRTASQNLLNVNPPAPYGGGSIWAEILVVNNTTAVLIDDLIDWRDKMIKLSGIIHGQGTLYMPGAASDAGINGLLGGESPESYMSAMFYSQQGSGNGSTMPYTTFQMAAGEDDLRFWVDDSTGELKCGKVATSEGSTFVCILEISYSPDMGHYS
jgi:hypothetical protein